MKIFRVGLFYAVLLGLLVVACTPEQTMSSPLEGIVLTDVSVEADETEKTIELTKTLVDVSVDATDLSTNRNCLWATPSINGSKLLVKLKENTTINDRSCRLSLYYSGARSDVENAGMRVEFVLVQRKNKIFDGLNIENLEFSAARCDTTLFTDRELKNVKVDVTELDGFTANWCTAKITGNSIRLQIQEFRSKDMRQALIRLYPNQEGVTPEDKLIAQTAMLITQHHNTILDSLVIDPVTIDYEGNKQVVHTGRNLTGIRAFAVDEHSHEPASWCNVSVAGDSVIVRGSLLSTLSERTALVTLYLPNNGDVIDETTLTSDFLVNQTHNTVFDETNIPPVVLDYDQTRFCFKFAKPMKDIKALVEDSVTNKTATWAWVSAVADSVVVTAAVHRNLEHRKARVTLYFPSQEDPKDATSVKTSFMIEQQHNTVFDNLEIKTTPVAHDQVADTLNIGRKLKDIRYQITDGKTGALVTWLSASVLSDAVVFRPQVNRENKNRTAQVTLYYPNQNNLLDSQTVRTTFTYVQKYNTVFDNLVIPTQTAAHDKTLDTLYLSNKNLKDVRCRLIDNSTGATPTWLSASVLNNAVVFRPQENRGTQNRSAHVMLYYPNQTNVLDSQTVRTSFMFVQKYNPVFTDYEPKDINMNGNQLYDTLKFDTSLKDIRCRLVDTESGNTPNWLTAKVENKMVTFKASSNVSNKNRSARVTLYYPNGNTINENTLQRTFLLTQLFKAQIVPEHSKMSLPYHKGDTTQLVSSNVWYEIEDTIQWVNCKMEPTSEFNGKLTINVLSENKTVSPRTGSLIFKSGENSTVIELTQRTNPAISFEELDSKAIVPFSRDGGSFILPVHTLTKDFKVSSSSKWLSFDKTRAVDSASYETRVYVQQFKDKGPERFDTIVVKNIERSKRLVVMQHKYIELEKSDLLLEAEQTYQLTYTNHTNNTIQWRSSNGNIAVVDQTGLITARKRGTTDIEAVIGYLKVHGTEFNNYRDVCRLQVYDVTDSILVALGAGTNYQKDGNQVTSDHAVTLTNDYHNSVEIQSVTIVSEDKSFSKVGTTTVGEEEKTSVNLPKGKSVSFNFGQLNNVYKPKVHIQINSGGKIFEKVWDY